MTDVIREWRVDLSKIVDKNYPEDLKKLFQELQKGKKVTNEKFNNIEKVFSETASNNFRKTEDISKELSSQLGKEIADNFKVKKIADFEETKNVLKICTKKIFGSENPILIA